MTTSTKTNPGLRELNDADLDCVAGGDTLNQVEGVLVKGLERAAAAVEKAVTTIVKAF